MIEKSSKLRRKGQTTGDDRPPSCPQKKAKSVWSGHEEFTREWSETFITKKGGKIEKEENDYEHLRLRIFR